MGLEAAVNGLQSALRVVEGGDRTTPEQAIEVYRVSDEAAKSRIADWKKLKSGEYGGVQSRRGEGRIASD